MTHPFDTLAIPAVDGRLLLTPCPGTQAASLAQALSTLQQAGASGVISLMPAAELQQNGADDIGAACGQLGLAWFHLPVADDRAPLADFDSCLASRRARPAGAAACWPVPGYSLQGRVWPYRPDCRPHPDCAGRATQHRHCASAGAAPQGYPAPGAPGVDRPVRRRLTFSETPHHDHQDRYQRFWPHRPPGTACRLGLARV